MIQLCQIYIGSFRKPESIVDGIELNVFLGLVSKIKIYEELFNEEDIHRWS